MSAPQGDKPSWKLLTILYFTGYIVIAVCAFSWGRMYERVEGDYGCQAGLEEISVACFESQEYLRDLCDENLGALEEARPYCELDDKTSQQERIFKWEVCFIDENCHNCLHQTHEGGSPSGDVEWCFEHAWDEMQPEYDVPDPFIPNYLTKGENQWLRRTDTITTWSTNTGSPEIFIKPCSKQFSKPTEPISKG